MRRGKFELRQTAAGDLKFYFVLKAGNGQVIAQSEMYDTKAAAKNGIRSVRFNAPFAKYVEVERKVLNED